MAVNCYILACEKTMDSVVIDPGGDPEKVLMMIRSEGLHVKYVINTHGHFDHTGGNKKILSATGAKLVIHKDDEMYLYSASADAVMYGMFVDNSPKPDIYLKEGASLKFGSYALKVLHTPGHTPGGCSLYLESEGKVFTGDTLFAEAVGRTDFPGGSRDDLIRSISSKLFTLPNSTMVYPGHGPETIVEKERKYTHFLR